MVRTLMAGTTRYLAILLTFFAAVVDADVLVFENARVFDGERLHESLTVIVEDGVIASLGDDVAIPEGATSIDASGATLLPGFIDSHGHSWGDHLERAAVWGVTTVIDMFTAPGFAAEQRAAQEAGEADHRADLVSAGVLATAPGGHGTQFGIEIPTLTAPEEADGWVEGRLAEGSDFIKIVLEDGTMVGRPIPTLDPPTFRAVVDAAQRRDQLAVVHATTLTMAELAADAGVDGFVHLFRDEAATEAWIADLLAGGMFVIPTLTVIESTTGTPSGASLVEDERLVPWLTAVERSGLTQGFPARPEAKLDTALASASRLHEAGVPILAGTDAPNPGTAHGVSMHRELELLVEAGLTPLEALTAATAAPADAFALVDRGRIARGRRADLVLVDGDPTSDIFATRAIRGVWKRGQAVARPEVEAGPDRPVVSGALADFDGGELSALTGFGWMESTDSMMSGKSTVALEVIAGGADGSTHALRVHGEVRPGFAFPWAGAMYFPASGPMAPADASGAGALVFQARGEPATYRVMAFAESLGQMPAQVSFEVGESWSEVSIELSSFRGLDPAGLTGFLWSGGPATGPFDFEIDQIELRPVD